MAFYQKFWDIIKMDLLEVFKEFHLNGVVGKSMNSTFISLVPKKDNSIKVGDFRPLSLVTSAFKILAEVLANRLGKVLGVDFFYSNCFCCRKTNLGWGFASK